MSNKTQEIVYKAATDSDRRKIKQGCRVKLSGPDEYIVSSVATGKVGKKRVKFPRVVRADGHGGLRSLQVGSVAHVGAGL